MLVTLNSANVREMTLRVGTPLRDAERKVILETLQQQNNNRTRTARVLGIGIRTLQRKLKQYDDVNTQLAG